MGRKLNGTLSAPSSSLTRFLHAGGQKKKTHRTLIKPRDFADWRHWR